MLTRSNMKLRGRGGFFAAALSLGAGILLAGYLALPLKAQVAVQNQGYVPYSDVPIYDRTRELNDPGARFKSRWTCGLSFALKTMPSISAGV